MTVAESIWLKNEKLIVTQISGQVIAEDVSKWEQSLLAALEQVPDHGAFKIMVNLHGFKAVNFEVHKQFRVIVPKTLADYNWRVGYLDLFPEAQIELKSTRGIRCLAAVHVHHDESKIKNYDENHGQPNERFFTDPVVARQWIDAFEINNDVLIN